MKDVISQRSINQLAEVAQNIDKTGYPAVIVSAGASLDKNIHELKKAEKSLEDAFITLVDENTEKLAKKQEEEMAKKEQKTNKNKGGKK